MNLCDVSGVGTKTLGLLNKLGINSVDDLVNYYPYKYKVLKRSNMNFLEDNESVVIDGVSECKGSVMYLSKGLKMVSFRINTSSNIFNVCVFNRPYLAREIYAGVKLTVIGKYNRMRNAIVASEVRFGLLNEDVTIESVYYVTHGLSKSMMAKIIRNAMSCPFDVKDNIPSDLALKYDFMSKNDAIMQIHAPTDIVLLRRARLRLKYEELFLYMLKVMYLKKRNKIRDGAIKRDIDRGKIDDFISKLQFSLTDDQTKAVNEILDDMGSDVRMNRLLQGDVGSGKTIVAFICCYANYLSHYQSALMVPTEILAKQHYEKASKLFSSYGVKIELLTSSVKKSDRKNILSRLESGDIDLIIGTQSLIQDDVKYYNLGLVITDEQHRFGVNQRTSIRDKGYMCDVLSMSATPIPRTYALTIYGDLDVSSIVTKPSLRKDIVTKVILEKDIVTCLELMYKELCLSHQIYVIAPLVLLEEDSDRESVDTLFKKMDKAFGNKFKIGRIHGKMSASEKEEVMKDYEEKKIDILISTTVIEVGIDVPLATMIVIFNAELFGLSTLHQLRGRVGRSDLQSYCLLVTHKECERLRVLEKTNDGFAISSYDFENRGEGDLFGIRQSGERHFQLADLRKDFKILLKAKEDACLYLDNVSDGCSLNDVLSCDLN